MMQEKYIAVVYIGDIKIKKDFTTFFFAGEKNPTGQQGRITLRS